MNDIAETEELIMNKKRLLIAVVACAILGVLVYVLFAHILPAKQPAETEVTLTQMPPEDDSPEERPIWSFCHGDADKLETAVITAADIDCEAGPIPVELTETEIASIRRLAMNGKVTGKENDMSVTGGTRVYVFQTPEGEYIMSIELYHGLLVATDGMYNYE